MTTPEVSPWLSTEAVLAQIGTGAASDAAGVERNRAAAAAYCEDNRADLWGWVEGEDPEVPVRVFNATPRVVMAGALAAARLYARKGSPTGTSTAAYGEYATQVLSYDPDVERMLGIGRYSAPAVG